MLVRVHAETVSTVAFANFFGLGRGTGEGGGIEGTRKDEQ